MTNQHTPEPAILSSQIITIDGETDWFVVLCANPCPACKGKGETLHEPVPRQGVHSPYWEPCADCNGTETIKANARTRASMVHKLQTELATLKAQRDELRRAVAFAGLIIAGIGTASVNSPESVKLARQWIDEAGAVLAKGKL